MGMAFSNMLVLSLRDKLCFILIMAYLLSFIEGFLGLFGLDGQRFNHVVEQVKDFLALLLDDTNLEFCFLRTYCIKIIAEFDNRSEGTVICMVM